MKFPLQKRLFGIGIAVLIVAATSAYTFLQKPDVPPVSGARRIIDIPGSTPYYWWIDPETVLIARIGTPSTFTRQRLDSTSQEPLTPLNSFFGETQGNPETVRIAPNGKWLLWTSKDRKTTAVVSLTETEKRYTVKTNDPCLAVWQLDSSGWIAVRISNDTMQLASFYSLNNPTKPERTLPLAYPMPAKESATNLRTATIDPAGWLMVQAWKGPDSSFENAHIFSSGFGPHPQEYRHLTVPAPHKNEGGELFFSPR